MRVGKSNYARPIPKKLSFISDSTGSISCIIEQQTLWTIKQGKLQRPALPAFSDHRLLSFFDTAQARFRQEVYESLNQRGFTKATRIAKDLADIHPTRLITYLLYEIRKRSHGGMLIFLKDANSKEMRPQLEEWFRFKVKGSNDALWSVEKVRQETQLRFNEYHLNDREQSFTAEQMRGFNQLHETVEQVRLRFHSVSEFIADLAMVDGAVVLSDKLQLVGFGAVVMPKEEPEEVTRIELNVLPPGSAEPGYTEKVRTDSWGTRHRAAIRLCQATEGALAIAISQDGDITAFMREGSQVLNWEMGIPLYTPFDPKGIPKPPLNAKDPPGTPVKIQAWVI